jgi:hypothetical protein
MRELSRVTERTSNGKSRSRSPPGMTNKKNHEKQEKHGSKKSAMSKKGVRSKKGNTVDLRG